MLYNQPYGDVADAPYINGDPSIGRAGSIPPAAAIEYPQRELVNFISDSGISPTNSDIRQVSKSAQLQKVNYSLDTGVANAYVATLSPVPDALQAGLLVRLKVATDNTGASVLIVNGQSGKNIVHADGSILNPRDMIAGMVANLCYDGTAFQLLGSTGNSTIGVHPVLIANKDYYVDTAIGNDAFDGLSAAAGHPFKTINRAIFVASDLNLNGYTVTIHVASGTYVENVYLRILNGNGSIVIIGNETTPANVHVNPASGPAVGWGGTFATFGYTLRGLKLSGVADGVNPGCGLFGGEGMVWLFNIEFGTASYAHMSLSGGTITIDQPGGSHGTIRITGAAPWHMQINSKGWVNMYLPHLVIVGTPNFNTAYADVRDLSQITGAYTDITGTATGSRYNVIGNGIIDVGGRGTSYLPGNAAGTLATGGQYL
jgi:hypothetical protein